MQYDMNISAVRRQEIIPLSDRFSDRDPNGRELGFTNYYMTMDGKPFFAISGECHFSRVDRRQWENTLLKMKAGGINVVATYVLWIHHEEVEGRFRFDGNRALRDFAQLCKKYGLFLIVRIGPFAHGEARNGGLPDWLYGKPFDVRSCNEGFLHCVRRFYHQIGMQLEGLMYRDGGPVIAAQLDNEYMHSAAPWEITTGISNEWMGVGSDGDAYLLRLKEIAREEGILTPFYTCTAWGGAATPVQEMMPLWGGYAYWPWIFHDRVFDHPATPEYIYRDNHNNAVRKTYNFEPFYDPESMPYACCEMGGGMSVCYNYRFQIDYESVDAMANVKLGSGCNFLGYYMYRGGTNPRGETTPFLNESHCAKISYDYQAPIGEFGQIRPSFHRLRVLHLFLKHFADRLCDLVTVLPEGSEKIAPEDTRTLRYAVRTDGTRGFLFLNNYQDHAVCEPKTDETVTLQLKQEQVTFSHLSLAARESAILPFHMDLDGVDLVSAKAQPLCVERKADRSRFFFFVPEGMEAEYVLRLAEDVSGPASAYEGSADRAGRNGGAGCQSGPASDTQEQRLLVLRPEAGWDASPVCLECGGRQIEIVTLTREESLKFYEVGTEPDVRHMLSDHVLLWDGENLAEEYESESEIELEAVPCGVSRYTITIPRWNESAEEVLLRIEYQGDIGHLFDASGTLLADNLSNGAVWETGLKEIGVKPGDILTLYITPLKENVHIDVSSTMAGRQESVGAMKAGVSRVSLRDVLFVFKVGTSSERVSP